MFASSRMPPLGSRSWCALGRIIGQLRSVSPLHRHIVGRTDTAAGARAARWPPILCGYRKPLLRGNQPLVKVVDGDGTQRQTLRCLLPSASLCLGCAFDRRP